MYPYENHILEPVDHQMQHQLIRGMGRIKSAKGTSPKPTKLPRLNDAHRKTYQNALTNMVPEPVRTITTASYEAVDTDQEFTLTELEDVLHRLKDTAPGDDTVCYSRIKNTPLLTRHLFFRLINQSFTEGRLPTRWKMTKIIPIPKKD